MDKTTLGSSAILGIRLAIMLVCGRAGMMLTNVLYNREATHLTTNQYALCCGITPLYT